MTKTETPDRETVYQSLLEAMGNYRPVWVQNGSTGETVHATEDGALKQAVTWAVAGDPVTVLTHHVWGVGGGRTSDFTDYRWKHRHIRWTESQWNVTTDDTIHQKHE